MKKKFIDLAGGDFCGHYLTYDVYIQGLTIRARYGNAEGDCVSCLIKDLQDQIRCVKSLDQGDREPLCFAGSPRAGDRRVFIQAMLSGLMFMDGEE